MSERKVLNKYYPPDFDPAKIPRMKLAKNRQYTVRLMAPFNMRCVTCGEYIYKGKKFNARKEDVEDQTYLGIRIYRFYIKCTRCLQEISFKTDPQNTDYEIEAGATRNFMALKLAEEQAKKEEDDLREEEANNPMKLLENRTQQSRNEIELLESLEELRDLNRRQQSVDYDTMLQQFNTAETERERQERLEKLDDEYVKTVNFQSNRRGVKRVAAEEIIDEKNGDNDNGLMTTKNVSIDTEVSKINTLPPPTSSTPKITTITSVSIGGFSQKKNFMKNLVKSKRNVEEKVATTVSESLPEVEPKSGTSTTPTATGANALSLLSNYSDSDGSD